MPLIADLFQIAILWTCLVGLGLAGRLVLPEAPFCLHFCLVPVILAAGLFFLEHFLPLGQLPWLWLPGLAVSWWLIRNMGKTLCRESVLWYFLLGFGVCFFWRYTFPDILAVSENLSDHAQLVTNSTGGLLPAEDIWVSGSKDDVYYVWQFYAAGLIHRFIGCSSGLTYHLGYCTMAGLTTAAIGAGIQAATRSLRAGWVASLCLVLGGNGATLVTPFMQQDQAPSYYASMRFIGSYAVLQTPETKTAFGVWLVNLIGQSQVDAPMEYYSYTLMLGDFHPPLSSMLFLGMAILGIGVAEVSKPGSLVDKICSAAVITTPFFLAISNTWTAPLQGVLVIGWFIYRRLTGRRDSFLFLFLSVFISYVAIAPFFLEFAHQSRSENALEWLQDRPPFLNWLLVMLPACVIWLGSLWMIRRVPLAPLVAVVGLSTMIGTYFFHIHDNYGGSFQIYNSTMKWWPWVYTTTVMLGLICVWPHKIWRSICLGLLFLSMAGSLYIFGYYWEKAAKNHMGRLDGYAWFTDDNVQKAVYEQALSLPKGVLIESVPPGAGSPALSIAQFTGNYSLAGYPAHEIQWRGDREDLTRIGENLDKFYEGALADPAGWLRGVVPGGVTYVVWLSRDNDRGLQIWPKLNEQLKGDYDWRSTYEYNAAHWGMWVQRKKPAN